MNINTTKFKMLLVMLAGIVAVGLLIGSSKAPAAQSSSSNTLTANVVVQSVCYISLSPNAISFGNLYPTAKQAANVLVTDSDPYGNAAATIMVLGGNWISGSNSFGVSNTTWSATSLSTFGGTQLTNSLVSTGITIAAPTQSDTTTSNSIYFGLSVPIAIPAGTYTQIITIENSC